MLRKLKIKFIIIIMTVVTVLFAGVFGFILHTTKQNIEKESLKMMQSAAFKPFKPNPDMSEHDKRGNMKSPFFTVQIGADGELIVSGNSLYDITDDELIKDIADKALSDGKQNGVIFDYNLRYCKVRQDKNEILVFGDISSERAMLDELIRNCILIGIVGYVIFFAISIILAEWVTRPVEKAWGEQKQFIADASHELKTPLTVIMTNAEMLTDNGYNENEKDNFTKNILISSKRMRGLVENLLELARMDSGFSDLAHEKLDYSRLVNDSILPFEPIFYENNMEIMFDIEDNIYVRGNKSKLTQVVNILLDNALKYSDNTSPIKVLLKSTGTLHCLLSVSGKGDSISKEDCKNIFKRFYRADKSRTDNHSYGLGLSIAYSIIKEHNGRIWAESENGLNTFFVLLSTE